MQNINLSVLNSYGFDTWRDDPLCVFFTDRHHESRRRHRAQDAMNLSKPQFSGLTQVFNNWMIFLYMGQSFSFNFQTNFLLLLLFQFAFSIYSGTVQLHFRFLLFKFNGFIVYLSPAYLIRYLCWNQKTPYININTYIKYVLLLI